jgi:CheY-like chemotaxis protein
MPILGEHGTVGTILEPVPGLEYTAHAGEYSEPMRTRRRQREKRVPERADANEGKPKDRARILLVAPASAASEAVANMLRRSGHEVTRTEALADAFAAAEKAGADAVVLEVKSSTTLGVWEAKRAKTDFAGRLIVCVPPDEPDVRKELLAELLPAATLIQGDDDALLEHVGRVMAIRRHRRELEECEEGLRECKLRKPRRERIFHRRRKAILVVSILIVVATAVAVPLVLMSLGSAADTVSNGVEDAADVVETMKRVEGYLQRDEERKIRRSSK